MRVFSTLLTLGILGAGAWWADQHYPELKYDIVDKVMSTDVPAFEARFTSQHISKKTKNGTPHLTLAPYLQMQVKHAKSENQTEETAILWDLTDGEMILNTKTWDKTHGYGDCLATRASAYEFNIINQLARKGGRAEINTLNRHDEHFITWLEACKRKKLVIQKGTECRLHMQNPRLALCPETEGPLPIQIIIKRTKTRLSKRFTSTQIRKMAEAAFGNDFAIQHVTEIWLPLYTVTTENSDGTQQTTYFNGITGKPFFKKS